MSKIAVFGWIGLLIVLAICSLFVGVSTVNLAGLLSFDGNQWTVFTITRIPRLVAVLLTGAGLSVCGLLMQQLANNKFTSPTTAGTISSAKLGILISLVVVPAGGLLIKSVFAVVTAFIGSIVFIRILKYLKMVDIIFVPLIGIMFGQIIDSFTEFFAYRYNIMQQFSAWLTGNFSLVISSRYEILYLMVPLFFVIYTWAQRFAIAGLGEDNATNLGINYNRVLYTGLLLISFMTALIVVTVGNIPFIGLIIPNIVSIYLGDNLKKNLWFTAVLGMVFILACDILARVIIFPFEMTVSAVTGSIGSLIFIYLIYRRYRHG